MPTHLDALFSAAYDDSLSGRDQDRFDDHLVHCERCATSFEEYQQSLDAVRALPRARMPVAVRLPEVSPGRSGTRGMAGLASTLGRLVAGRRIATALGALAAAALLVIAVRSPATSQPSLAVQAPAASPSSITAEVPGVARPQAANAGSGSTDGAGCTTRFEGIAASATVPASFANRTTVTDPSRPGEELTLATENTRYAAGAQLLVYARLTTPADSAAGPGSTAPPSVTVYLPCVELGAGGGSAPLELSTLPAQATIAPGMQAQGIPLQTITIPSTLTPGTMVTLSAVIPSGTPSASQRGELRASVEVTIG